MCIVIKNNWRIVMKVGMNPNAISFGRSRFTVGGTVEETVGVIKYDNPSKKEIKSIVNPLKSVLNIF